MSPPGRRSAASAAASSDPSAPLHLVTGPEDLLADRAVERVVAAARAGAPDIQVVTVEAGGYTAGDLAAHATPSLFGEGTVLVVRGLEDAPDELVEDARALVEAPAPDTVLVLRHRSGQRGKGLLDAARKAGASVHDCAKITSDADKTTFVQSEFRTARRSISPDAVAALVEALGQDVRELANACAQLMADTTVPDGRPQDAPAVDVTIVDRYYGGRVEATGFKVADAAIAGQTDEALGSAAARVVVRRRPRADRRRARHGPALAGQGVQRGLGAVGRCRSRPRDGALAGRQGAPPAAGLVARRPGAGHRGGRGRRPRRQGRPAAAWPARGRPVFAVEKAVLQIGAARRLRD